MAIFEIDKKKKWNWINKFAFRLRGNQYLDWLITTYIIKFTNIDFECSCIKFSNNEHYNASLISIFNKYSVVNGRNK